MAGALSPRRVPPPVSLLLLRGFPPCWVLRRSVCPCPCPCPLCGPGSTGRAWRGRAWWGQGGVLACHLQQGHDSSHAAPIPVPALVSSPGWVCAKAPGWGWSRGFGGSSVVTPQCRDLSWAAPTAPFAARAAPLWALHREIRTPFSPDPPRASAPGRGTPDPVSACGQRGPCQGCSNPPGSPPLAPGVPGRWHTRGQRWRRGGRGARCM